MRLTTFINESNQEYDHAEMVTILLRYCMPYLKDRKFDQHFPDDHLYSGREKGDLDFFESIIRPDREPKDTPGWLHKELDEKFHKKFGVKSRSNALFTTGSRGQAMGYGDVYIIFPKGPYTVVWSDEITDLFISIKNIYINAMNIESHYFDFNDSIEDMLSYAEGDDSYDKNDYIDERATEEYEKYYGEDTKGGIWTYEFDENNIEDLEKSKYNKKQKRDIFIKGFKKDDVEDAIHKNYGSLYRPNLVWSPDISLEDFTDKNYGKYEQEYFTQKVKAVEDQIEYDMKDLINSYNKGDIQGAIESGNEVMLSSTHGYCALMDRRDNRDPIFHFFKEYGYHFPEDIKKRIGQEKWDHFKDSVNFDSSI